MKRILTLTLSLVLAVVLCFTMLTGCALVKTDSQKDMNQVVATIKLSDNVKEEKIYKKDLILAYMNKYYQNEQNGASREAVFDVMVSNLIEEKIMVQGAIIYFGQKSDEVDKNGVWTAEQFLSDDVDKPKALYYTLKSINDLIDDFNDEKEEDKVQDSYSGEDRAVPKDAKNAEISLGEMKEYNKKGIEVASRRKAYNKFIKSLKNNELLGDYNGSDVTSTDYYINLLKSNYESILLQKYSQDVAKEVRSKLTFGDLKSAYEEIYNTQKGWSREEFIKASSELAADTDPIVVGNSESNGYGRVYHILLSASDEQVKQVQDWYDEKEKAGNMPMSAEIEQKRKEVFTNVKAFDQRSAWIIKGYDFDGKYFTGDYTFLENEADRIEYKGTLIDLTKDAPQSEKEYFAQIKETDKMSFDDFISFMEEYLYGSNKLESVGEGKKLKDETKIDPIIFEQKIKELMFAFSGDGSDGALNSYKGYEITPNPEKNQMAVAFWEGGKELISGKFGQFGYVVKATEFGYHIMFLSEAYGASYDYNELEKYLDKEYSLGEYADWEAYYKDMLAKWDDWKQTDNYLYILTNKLSEKTINDEVAKKQVDLINAHINNTKFVTRNDSVYQDLIK